MITSEFSMPDLENRFWSWRNLRRGSPVNKARNQLPFPGPVEDFLVFAEDALSKALRPFVRNVIHTEFLSQGFFKRLAKELGEGGQAVRCVETPEAINIVDVNASDVILICGSDAELVGGQTKNFSQNFMFAQNLNTQMTSTLRPLPIGVEDIAYFRNGLPINLRSPKTKRPKLDRVLVGPFRPTNPARRELLELVSDFSNCDVIDRRISAFTYGKVASRYHFVACPPGNGLDTHRMWETMYRGSIPVLTDSPFARNWQALGAPLVIIEKWEDLAQLRIADLDIQRDLAILNVNVWQRWIKSPSEAFDSLKQD